MVWRNAKAPQQCSWRKYFLDALRAEKTLLVAANVVYFPFLDSIRWNSSMTLAEPAEPRLKITALEKKL